MYKTKAHSHTGGSQGGSNLIFKNIFAAVKQKPCSWCESEKWIAYPLFLLCFYLRGLKTLEQPPTQQVAEGTFHEPLVF